MEHGSAEHIQAWFQKADFLERTGKQTLFGLCRLCCCEQLFKNTKTTLSNLVIQIQATVCQPPGLWSSQHAALIPCCGPPLSLSPLHPETNQISTAFPVPPLGSRPITTRPITVCRDTEITQACWPPHLTQPGVSQCLGVDWWATAPEAPYSKEQVWGCSLLLSSDQTRDHSGQSNPRKPDTASAFKQSP